MVRSEVVGSLEFFGANPMPEDDALLGLTAKASTQLGRTLEREGNETLLAGVAVENARLYEQSRERLAWIEATVSQRMECGDHWLLYAEAVSGALVDPKGTTAVHQRRTGQRY